MLFLSVILKAGGGGGANIESAVNYHRPYLHPMSSAADPYKGGVGTQRPGISITLYFSAPRVSGNCLSYSNG